MPQPSECSLLVAVLVMATVVTKIDALRCYECVLCDDNFVPNVNTISYSCPTACGKISVLSANGNSHATKRFCHRRSTWNNCSLATSLPDWNNATDSCRLCESDFCNGPPCTFGAFCGKTEAADAGRGNNTKGGSTPIQNTGERRPRADLEVWKIVGGVAVGVIVLAVLAIACNCGSSVRTRRR